MGDVFSLFFQLSRKFKWFSTFALSSVSVRTHYSVTQQSNANRHTKHAIHHMVFNNNCTSRAAFIFVRSHAKFLHSTNKTRSAAHLDEMHVSERCHWLVRRNRRRCRNRRRIYFHSSSLAVCVCVLLMASRGIQIMPQCQRILHERNRDG